MKDRFLEDNLKLYNKILQLKKIGRNDNKIIKQQKSIRQDILSCVDDQIIPVKDFFCLLKKLEDRNLLKFELYRYYYSSNFSDEKSFKDGIEFFECSHKEMNISLRLLFSYFNFDKDNDKFSNKEKIEYGDIIDPDYQLVLEGIKKYYPKEYNNFANIIVRYLLKEYSIV